MSFCFTSTFHLQSPSQAKGAPCDLFLWRENTQSYNKNSMCPILHWTWRQNIYPRLLKFTSEALNVPLTQWHIFIFCLDGVFTPTVYYARPYCCWSHLCSCLLARTVISHSFIFLSAFVATLCVTWVGHIKAFSRASDFWQKLDIQSHNIRQFFVVGL